MVSKKGLGHVEVIAAFILFIGFLLFGLYFFNPLNTDRLLDSTLSYAEKAVRENVTTSVITYTIILNQTASGPVSVSLDKGEIEDVNGAYVEDDEGVAVPSSYDGTAVSFHPQTLGTFFYIRYGNFGSKETVASGAPLVEGVNFTVASSDITEVFSEQAFLTLQKEYQANYMGLKERFNLPRRTDLGIDVVFGERDRISLTQPIPEGIEVASRNDRHQVVRLNGSVQFADVFITIW